MRLLLRLLLEADCGTWVRGEAGDAETALAMAAVIAPDLVVLDVDLPGQSGLQALPEVRRLLPDAPVVVVSGMADAVVAAQVARRSNAHFVEKQHLHRQLPALVEELFAGNGNPAGDAPA